MSKLVEILKSETESLKIQYIEKTKEYAVAFYNNCIVKSKWSEADWCKYYGLVPEIRKNFYGSEYLVFPKGFYNSRNARIYERDRNVVFKLLKLGLEEFLKTEIKSAEIHYENSILKLADRIEKKGLDIEKLKATTSHIGVNINTVLTDGVKSVRAFTIIAEGEIQRPHYRYLIK